jgi:hypothetical protein
MAVYIVYRSHYHDPSGKQMKRFADTTVLDWFGNHWQHLAHADAYDRLDELLGFSIYGFGSLFERAAENELPPPESDDELAAYLDEYLYSEGPILYEPHLLTVQTDDDELEVAYYVFDDHYLARHGKLAAYLLHEGWRLPGNHAEGWFFEPTEPTLDHLPPGRGSGVTYLVSNTFSDSCNLSDLSPASYVEGVRIPDLARYLLGLDPSTSPGDSVLLLRSQLLAVPLTAEPIEQRFYQALLTNPDDEASWRACCDWLHEQSGRPGGLVLLENALTAVTRLPLLELPDGAWSGLEAGNVAEARQVLEAEMAAHPSGRPRRHDPAKSRLQVDEHVVVLCLHVSRWGEVDVYQQWIFFDDLWAAAHPDLANALLRYERCWDVLNPDGPRDEE